jgi:hypothetical protein
LLKADFVALVPLLDADLDRWDRYLAEARPTP